MRQALTPHALRRRLGSLVIERFFELGSAAWRALPSAQPERHGVHRTTDVAYREDGDPAHLLDVYRPTEPSEGPRPALLYIHGGSFRILSKDSHFMIATALARAGYVVFTINYRLSPAHRFPAAVEDVADAYRFVVQEAPRWDADPSRLVVAGESAGGNLALCATVMATYERPEAYARRVYKLGVVPKAIVPLCGIFQVTDPHRARSQPINTFLQDRVDLCAEDYLGEPLPMPAPERALADPLLLLEGGPPARAFPPTFASVGTRDPLLDDTTRLEAALARLGVPCEARIYPGEPHAFQALTFRPLVQRHWQEVFDFLHRYV